MRSNQSTVFRFICPALAVLTSVVALYAPWFTRTTMVTQRTREATLLEAIRGEAFVEFTSTRNIWLSAIGLLLIIVSAFVANGQRKKTASVGAGLMLILPVFSMLSAQFGDVNVDAGWGMWAALVLAIVIIALARVLPLDQDEEPALLEPIEMQ